MALTEVMGCVPSFAQVRQFDIPSEEAGRSISELSLQAGVPIIGPGEKLRGIVTPEIKGDFDVIAALELMLKGTGLKASRSPEGVIVISPMNNKNVCDEGEPMSSQSKLLSGASLLAMALATSQCALAQEEQMETVVVTGIRASIVQGLENKRNSNVVVESIAAEDIGKMPDSNLAEAIQRVPGISIDRDGGEGRYVTIRGLGPQFNTVLVDGRRIATSEGSRSFGFDTISSDLVGGINVYKTQEAFIREGGVGGTVDIRTLRPLDHLGFHAVGRLEGEHENQSGKTSPQGSFLLSDTFLGDKLGILVSGSYQERQNRTFEVSTYQIRTPQVFAASTCNNASPYCSVPPVISAAWAGTTGTTPQGYWTGYDSYGLGTLYGPMELDRNVTNERRQRLGGTAAIQYRPNDDMEFNVDYLYSKFNVVSNTMQVGNWLWELMPPASTADWIRTNFAYYNFSDAAHDYGINDPTSFSNVFADYVAARSHTTVDKNGVVTFANTFPGSGSQAFNSTIIKRPDVTQMVGLNFKWNVSEKLVATFDAAFSGASQNNKGLNRRRSLEHVGVGTFDYNNPNGIPYTTNVDPLLAASATDDHLFYRREYNSGTDINATNKEASADFEYKPWVGTTVRVGGLYEVGQKRSTDYGTADSVPCVNGTMSTCWIQEYFSRYDNPSNPGYQPVTQANLNTLIFGVNKPNPKDFGMPASADVNTLILNYAGMDAYANNPANYTAVPFNYTSAGTSSLTAAQKADAIATYEAYKADHGGNVLAAGPDGVGWDVTEKVSSFYLNAIQEGTLPQDLPYVLTVGLRYSHTDIKSSGYTQVITDLTRSCPTPGCGTGGNGYNNLVATYATGTGPDGRWVPGVVLTTATASYNNFLPDVALKVNLRDNLIWRVGASQSMTRPELDDLVPSYTFNILNATGSSAITKNPYLKPLVSTNFDTAAEWYYGEGNAITFDAFWKNLKGLIVTGTTTGVQIPTITSATFNSFTVSMPINAKAVAVWGATLGWTHSFEFGLGWQVNYTWTGTNWVYNPSTWDSTNISLPGLSNNFNAVLFYEHYGFSARVAYNWRSKFLYQTNFPSGWYGEVLNEPVFEKSYSQVDARVGYDVMDNAQIYIEGTNLLGANVTKVGRFDNLLIARDGYGSNIVAGVSLKLN